MRCCEGHLAGLERREGLFGLVAEVVLGLAPRVLEERLHLQFEGSGKPIAISSVVKDAPGSRATTTAQSMGSLTIAPSRLAWNND